MTDFQRNAILKEWVERLGLQRWAIKANLNAAPEDFSAFDEIMAGETEWVAVTRRATIRILRKEAYSDPSEYNFECTLVHELLHLVFSPFYPSTGDCLETVIHCIIEDMAVALVDAKYSPVCIDADE